MDDDECLGPMELNTTEAEWPKGSIIERDGARDLRASGDLGSDNPEQFAVLVLEPVFWSET